MTADPLAWLTDAMDAAQRDAEAATPGPWDPEGDDPTDDIVFTICETPDLVGDVVAYTRGQKHQVPNMVHIARHDPAAVLRRIAADRKLIADIQDARHKTDSDNWFTCAAATMERDGDRTCLPDERSGPCNCGRDNRVERRLRIIAEGYGHPAFPKCGATFVSRACIRPELHDGPHEDEILGEWED